MQYDAQKRKDMFKEITEIAIDALVTYRHLDALAITFESDHHHTTDHFLESMECFRRGILDKNI